MRIRLAAFLLVTALAALAVVAASAGQTPRPQNLTLAGPGILKAEGLSRADFYRRLGTLQGDQLVDVSGKRMTKAELLRSLDAAKAQLSNPLVASHRKGTPHALDELRLKRAALERRRHDVVAAESAKAFAAIARFK